MWKLYLISFCNFLFLIFVVLLLLIYWFLRGFGCDLFFCCILLLQFVESFLVAFFSCGFWEIISIWQNFQLDLNCFNYVLIIFVLLSFKAFVYTTFNFLFFFLLFTDSSEKNMKSYYFFLNCQNLKFVVVYFLIIFNYIYTIFCYSRY